jgi:hypothetical protein
MNLSHLEIGIYFSLDGNDFIFSGKEIQECPEVRMHARLGGV